MIEKLNIDSFLEPNYPKLQKKLQYHLTLTTLYQFNLINESEYNRIMGMMNGDNEMNELAYILIDNINKVLTIYEFTT